MKFETKTKQMSESLLTISCITLSGGFQDAYTYFARGKVFANAETGNIVLMASHFCDLDFIGALHYFVPLLFFIFGVFIAEQIEGYHKHRKNIHWRQIVLVPEILLLLISGFLSEDLNLLVNSMISFACAMQVQAFRRWNGNSYASTMCIGNIRSGVANFSAYLRDKDPHALRRCADYFIVIFIFFIGTGLGFIAVKYFHLQAIWFSCAALTLAVLCMHYNNQD
ncbi:MAG: DUF1275 domain-containing protein [Solobacterium sp.]|nr:DUF1275 domain-containing protein [Solobacterium sp.]MCH4206033.1 DUF1275 domain-containing protein [Solobacterium sp.]MCH4227523.1 DUF1275 domain-containing protein [Solobacterium sp.]MCH4282947.1 DUF1275 domain-containing protein [Solobacterium sp.]